MKAPVIIFKAVAHDFSKIMKNIKSKEKKEQSIQNIWIPNIPKTPVKTTQQKNH